MSTPKKPRSDSPLRMLPEDRQAEVLAYLEGHSVAETVKWLAQDGFKASSGALSEWRSWYLLRQSYKETKSDVETILDNIRRNAEAKGETVSEEELFSYGQETFAVLALKGKDAKEWARIQSLGLEGKRISGLERRVKVAEEALALAEQKFQFDAATECLKKLPTLRSIATKPGLDQKEKVRQIRLALFGSAPE